MGAMQASAKRRVPAAETRIVHVRVPPEPTSMPDLHGAIFGANVHRGQFDTGLCGRYCRGTAMDHIFFFYRNPA